jgi:hypothetical protein
MENRITHWTQLADASTSAAEIVSDWQSERPGAQGLSDFSEWLQVRASQIDPTTFEEVADNTNWEVVARQIMKDAEKED